jgi:ATP-dependent exoDNAse (exonuclease V) beta subunit
MLPHPQGPGTLTAQIDLALKEPDGWVLLDWKSDRDQRGLQHHQAQLSAYAHAFEQSGAGAVKECVLVFGRG